MSQVYANILQSLTTGLYIQINIALREYLQNAYDAVKAAKICKIPEPMDGYHVEVKITKNESTVTISDNGIGMSMVVLEEYTSIGGGTKDSPDFAGHKGIGKLAGLRFFDHFVVRTKQTGTNTGYQLSWRSGDMMRTLLSDPKLMKTIPYGTFIKDYYELSSFREEDVSLHFTQVQLIDVMEEFKNELKEDAILNFIQGNCPVPFLADSFNYKEMLTKYLDDCFMPVITYVNDKVVYQPYRDSHNLIIPIMNDVKYEDRLKAKVWFSWVKNSAGGIDNEAHITGIKFRCKGICVGDRNLFANNCMPEGRNSVADWFTGEICVTDDKIRPNTARDGFEKSETVRKFYLEIKKRIGKTISSLATVRSEIHAAEQHLVKMEEMLAMGKLLNPLDLQKLDSRNKELKKYRDKDMFSLDFTVISRIDNILNVAEVGANEQKESVAKKINDAIEQGNTRDLMKEMLDLKTKEIQTHSTKTKKEIKSLIEKASEAILKHTKDSVVNTSDPNDKEILVTKIILAYLKQKDIPYKENEVVEFVRREMGK